MNRLADLKLLVRVAVEAILQWVRDIKKMCIKKKMTYNSQLDFNSIGIPYLKIRKFGYSLDLNPRRLISCECLKSLSRP